MIVTSRRVAAVALVVLLACYLRWLTPSLAPYAGSADSAGYLWSARLFRSGDLSRPILTPAGFPLDAVGRTALAPLGTDVQHTTGELVPTYPTGFPLHLALGQALARDEERGTRAVLLVIAGAALWLCYRLGREAHLSRMWAAVACATLAVSPLSLFIAVQPMSDLLALAWAEATIFFAWRSRRRAAFAPAAGASLGLAALVRPTSLVLVVPLVVACPRRLRGVALGLLGPTAFVLTYQALVYGSPFRTGYGDVSSAFSLAYAGPSAKQYLAWIPWLASPIVVVAPGAWWAWRGALARWRAIALAWVVAFLGLYAFYFHTAEHWWYLRFVLPAFPPLIVAGAATLQAASRWQVGRSGGLASRVVAIAAAAVALLSLLAQTRQPTFDAHRSVRPQERLYRETVQWMALSGFTRGPVAAVQLSGALNYYAPSTPVLRHDRLSEDTWRAIRRWQATSGQDVHAALFPFERESSLAERLRWPCEWEPRGSFRGVSFWRCAARSR